jgi:hypothetical protein
VSTTGSYWAMVTDANGCSNSDTINITMVGVNDHSVLSNLDIYPNPNQGSFWVINKDNQGKDLQCELLDIEGRVVFKQNLVIESKLRKLIKPDNLSKGVYYLKLQSEGSSWVEKVVIQ